MTSRDFLYETALPDLKSIVSTEPISIERLNFINQQIHEFETHHKDPPETIQETEYDDDYGNSNEDSLYNRPGFNHDLDIDQQGPDFDF